MAGNRHDAARRRTERERAAGLDPDDEAARWLAEHDPPEPERPKPTKSKALHRFRRQQQRQR